MRQFININRVSVAPKYYIAPNKRKIQWRSDTTPFDQFYAEVNAYNDANGFGQISRESLIDMICQQLPRRECVDEGYHAMNTGARADADPYATGRNRSGCSSCGKRR